MLVLFFKKIIISIMPLTAVGASRAAALALGKTSSSSTSSLSKQASASRMRNNSSSKSSSVRSTFKETSNNSTKIVRGPSGANLFDDVRLSADQRQVMKMIERGENVFFTGAAGTGVMFMNIRFEKIWFFCSDYFYRNRFCCELQLLH